MEPIEINAGTWYLRALRADERVDDRPTLLTGATDPDTMRYAPHMAAKSNAAATEHVRLRAGQWSDDARYSWAVCNPTTGEMLAEVGLCNIEHTERTAEIVCWTAPTHRNKGIMATAAAAVVRLALAPEVMGGLGLHRVSYLHVDGNTAAAALAQRCGMVAEGRLREAVLIDGARRDMMLLARLATD